MIIYSLWWVKLNERLNMLIWCLKMRFVRFDFRIIKPRLL